MVKKYVQKKDDVTLFPTAFYVLRDEKDKTYLISTRGLIFGDLHESRAHFETEKSALEGIKELRRRGLDVSSLVIVPVAMTPKTAIVPKLIKQKSGYVIKITYTDFKPHRHGFYKGNKKKPLASTENPYDALYSTTKQTITATVFDTQEAAEQRISEIKAAVQHKATAKLNDGYSREWERDERKRWKRRAEGEEFAFNVEKV